MVIKDVGKCNIKLEKTTNTIINIYRSLIFSRNIPLMIQDKLFKMSDVGEGGLGFLKLEFGGGVKRQLINLC